MKLIERVSRKLRAYPFRQRVPGVIALLCFYGWEIYRTKRTTPTLVLIMVVVFLAALFGRQSRPFWFLLGIALGTVLGLIVPHFSF
jgi:hypothetical protein